MMKLLRNIYIIGLGLYLKDNRTLILCDLHLGLEENLINQGDFLSKKNFITIKKHLNYILSKTEIKTVIFNGDIKHEFGRINLTEWDYCLGLIDMLKDKEMILIKGNHDKMTSIIAKKRDLKVRDYYITNNVFVCHGDILFNNYYNSKTIIIGHEHPAISLKEGPKSELFKCFLLGKFKNKNLIVIPSFSFVNIGSDILKYEKLSPYLQQNLDNFKIYITENNEIYPFGKINDLR